MNKYKGEDDDKKKRRRMGKFRIDELSAVDRPAQAPALAIIMKRDDQDGDKKVEKSASVLTDSVEGHTHLLTFHGEGNGGETSWVVDVEGNGHNHPWVWTPSEGLVIGAADGHTHSVPESMFAEVAASALFKSKTSESPDGGEKGDDMDKQDVKLKVKIDVDSDEFKEAVADLRGSLEKAQNWANLSDSEKEFAKSLDDQDAFAALTTDERGAQIEKSKASVKLIYKAHDGTEYTDVEKAALAKSLDEVKSEARLEKARREEVEFAKRANDELPSIPGEVPAKVALLKAVSRIEDEKVRTSVEELLKAANGRGGILDKSKGVTGATSASDVPAGDSAAADLQLQEIAKGIMNEKDGPKNIDEAYSIAGDRNPGLYSQACGV